MSDPSLTLMSPAIVMASAIESRHEASAVLALFSLDVVDDPTVIAGATARLAMNAHAVDFPLDHIIEGLKSNELMRPKKARKHVQSKVEPGHAGHWFAKGDPVQDLVDFGRGLRALCPKYFDGYVDDLVESLEYINLVEYAHLRYAQPLAE